MKWEGGRGRKEERQHEHRSKSDGEVDRERIGGKTIISELDQSIFTHKY